MKTCYNHLLSSVENQTNKDEPQTYYTAVNEFALEEAKNKIEEVLNDALEN